MIVNKTTFLKRWNDISNVNISLITTIKINTLLKQAMKHDKCRTIKTRILTVTVMNETKNRYVTQQL